MLGALKRLLPSRLCPLDRTISSASRAILFQHLTRKTEERIDASSSKSYKARIFDKVRSERLHWIKHHIDERSPNLIEVFTLTERRDGKDATRTYIYDTSQAYVIILEHQRKGGYYLLTAYYLSEVYAKKQLEKKMKLSQIQDLNKTQGSIHI